MALQYPGLTWGTAVLPGSLASLALAGWLQTVSYEGCEGREGFLDW